jgi:hypothetical protein
MLEWQKKLKLSRVKPGLSGNLCCSTSKKKKIQFVGINYKYYISWISKINCSEKKICAKKWGEQLIRIKVNSATYLAYLALRHIPEGSSQFPWCLSYSRASQAASEGEVHLSLFMGESQFYNVTLSEKVDKMLKLKDACEHSSPRLVGKV